MRQEATSLSLYCPKGVIGPDLNPLARGRGLAERLYIALNAFLFRFCAMLRNVLSSSSYQHGFPCTHPSFSSSFVTINFKSLCVKPMSWLHSVRYNRFPNGGRNEELRVLATVLAPRHNRHTRPQSSLRIGHLRRLGKRE